MIYGIDLGTTNSCIASIDKFGIPKVYQNEDGSRTTPSVVYFPTEDNKKVRVGSVAQMQQRATPWECVECVKRFMGKDGAFDPAANTFPNHYDPSQISALILKKLKKDMENMHNEEVKEVVITVPAGFGTKARERTKQAGVIAGLKVIDIFEEPVAAALSYSVGRDKTESVLVYDLGGGTFDAAFIKFIYDEEEDRTIYRLVTSDGDTELGGRDWDTALANEVLRMFNQQKGTNYSFDQNDHSSQQLKYYLLQTAEAVKKILSGTDEATFSIEYEGKTFSTVITREQFNILTKDLLDLTIEKTRKVLEVAQQNGFGLPDKLLLVGGSSRMPQVKERLTKEFGSLGAIKIQFEDPDECVAKGAAFYAAHLEKIKKGPDTPDNPIITVLTKTYGLGIKDERVTNLLYKDSILPIKIKHPFVTAFENQSELFLPIYESNFRQGEADQVVSEADCQLVNSDNSMKLSKGYPIDTPIDVTFEVGKDGILKVLCEIANETPFHFDLHVTGVKNEEELKESIEEIGKKQIN